MLSFHQSPKVENIIDNSFLKKQVQLDIKREDLIHPFVSGNKWRKLKYNLIVAKDQGHNTLLTFGGAYSNHIYATAAAAAEIGFKSIGIIRGEELANKPLNPTLKFAQSQGMMLHFVSRETYKYKLSEQMLMEWQRQFGKYYLLPEGGTNQLAIKGCSEILNENTFQYDYIFVPVGTGGTLAGVITAAQPHQKVFGVAVLKGGFLAREVSELLSHYDNRNYTNWEILNDYHFGGYAKTANVLLTFIKQFEKSHGILLDQVYTGKMMYAIYDLMKNGCFQSGQKILAIHTGGLQGRKVTE